MDSALAQQPAWKLGRIPSPVMTGKYHALGLSLCMARTSLCRRHASFLSSVSCTAALRRGWEWPRYSRQVLLRACSWEERGGGSKQGCRERIFKKDNAKRGGIRRFQVTGARACWCEREAQGPLRSGSASAAGESVACVRSGC